MKLVEFFAPEEIDLDLEASTKEEALQELVDLLDVGDSSEELYGLLKKRENLGSTGIGKGVAIPHCRSLVVDRLRVVYGRKEAGLGFGAVDGKPVHHLFLIVAGRDLQPVPSRSRKDRAVLQEPAEPVATRRGAFRGGLHEGAGRGESLRWPATSTAPSIA